MKLWTRIEQWFKRRSLAIGERLFDRGRKTPHEVNRKAIKRILVIRQHDYLGDFLLATPVLRALRESFPHCHLGVLVRSYAEDVARHNQFIDEILVFQENGWQWTPAKLWRFWRQLRDSWELAVVLNTVSHSFTSDVLARLSRARYVLGSEHRVFVGCRRNFLYDLEAPYYNGKRHQTDRNLDVVRFIGADTPHREEHLTLRPIDQRFAEQFLERNAVQAAAPVVAMHLGAGKPTNRWPARNFAELANSLHQEFAAQIIAAWGPKENDLGNAFLAQLHFTPALLVNVSLRQLAAVLARAEVFVCNDTGVMHVGAAAGAPVVAIFGPTDPEEWKPIGHNILAVRDASGDCAQVSVDRVRQAIRSLLPSRHAQGAFAQEN